MNQSKLAVVCGIIAAIGLSFTGQVWAADAETKKHRQEMRKEIHQDRKEIRQDSEQLQRDRRALREAIARKAPAGEIARLRAKVKAGETEVAGDRKELRSDRMERKHDVRELRQDQKALKSIK